VKLDAGKVAGILKGYTPAHIPKVNLHGLWRHFRGAADHLRVLEP